MSFAIARSALERQAATPTVLGIVKTTYPRHRTAAVNEANFDRAAVLEAWARHAAVANGFGESPLPTGAVTAPPAASLATNRGDRSASFGAIVAAVGSAIAAAARRAWQRWREQRDLRRTVVALAELDERTLKDIGVSGQEIGSLAAELAGRAERSRRQAIRALNELAL